MPISQARIDRILDELGIDDYLDELGLEPAHGRYPCPIHEGKDRNLSHSKGRFRCWSCGEAGSVIDLIRQAEGLPFPAAIDRAEGLLGLSGEPTPQAERKASQRRLRRDLTAAHVRRLLDRLCLIDATILETSQTLADAMYAAGLQADFTFEEAQEVGRLIHLLDTSERRAEDIEDRLSELKRK